MGKAKKDRKNFKNAIKIIAYILLIGGCVVLFIIFGRKKTGYIPAAADVPSPEPAPALPLRLDLMLALAKCGMPCGFSDPVQGKNGAEMYELLFEDKKDSGSLSVETDFIGHVTRCELKLNYMFAGTPPEGAVNDVLSREYQRRGALHNDLIQKYICAAVDALDYSDSVNSAELMAVTDNVIKAYYKMSAYDKSFGKLRFNVYTGREDIHITFILVITLKNS